MEEYSLSGTVLEEKGWTKIARWLGSCTANSTSSGDWRDVNG